MLQKLILGTEYFIFLLFLYTTQVCKLCKKTVFMFYHVTDAMGC